MRLCSRNRLLFTALALALLATACAQERPPINRVQPYALKKSFFVGDKLLDPSDDPEFWAQGTLTDVGYGAGQDGLFTSTYAQPVSRVKFVIEENYLIARLTYELINNSDGHGAGAASDNGIVVAMYRINGHFDIKRAYNSTTGEEYNVLDENAQDRPWYEREYFRVDWSKNLMPDNYELDTLAAVGVQGVTYEPIDFWINDPDSEDAPHFDLANGYFDVTNKAFARPKLVDIAHFGWGIDLIPACYTDADFMGGPGLGTQCNPVELTIRQSFRRVDMADYQPEEWTGTKFKAFGAFTCDRRGYARNYGIVDSDWHRFIERYNIWDQSHYYDPQTGNPVECYTPKTTPVGSDPNRDEDGNGTADECESVSKLAKATGSQCDTFTQKCTLPFRARTEKTLVWYMTNTSNYEYFDGTDWAAQEWDVALRQAVLTARYAECARTGADNCGARFPVITEGQIEEENDAIRLAWDVDECRRAKIYSDRGLSCDQFVDPDMKSRCDRLTAAFASVKDCTKLADSISSKRNYTDAVKALAKRDEMIVLCHSPVQADDPDICAPASQRLSPKLSAAMCADAIRNNKTDLLPECRAALNVRVGDLRYHRINVVQNPQTPSPWGIMADSSDPLTGMKIAASVNVWSHVTDLASQIVVDQSRLVKGELTPADVTEGTYIDNWAKAASHVGGITSTQLTAAAMDKRMADFAGVDVPTFKSLTAKHDAKAQQFHTSLLANLKAQNVMFDAKAQGGSGSANAITYETRRQMAMGTPLEAALTTRMMQELAGSFGATTTSAELLPYVSPLRMLNPTVQREINRAKDLAMADRGYCILNEAPVNLAVGPMADVLERKFGGFNPDDDKTAQFLRAEKMRRYIAQRYQFAVIAHEMGHSVGLRHNFVSSSDAFNFRPQYWQLRTNDGKVTTECTDLVNETQAANCVGPRWFDPVTKTERDNLIWMFMNQSVMEYPGETTQDMIGIGGYDFGAARMFYGNVVGVYTDPGYNANGAQGRGVLTNMDDFGGILGYRYSPTRNLPSGADSIHYSQLQDHYTLIHGCQEVADVQAFKPWDWNEARDGVWDPVMDGMLVSPAGDGKYTRCHTQPMDYVQWDGMSETDHQTSDSDRQQDPNGRVRVRYGFGTDRWADLGNLSVYRHDNGADAYEVFDFFITSQEMNHIFDNYRRGRSTFTVYGAAGRALSRYNTKMRDGAKGMGFLANIYRRATIDAGIPLEAIWTLLVDEFRPNVLASTMAFDHFARQLARPEEGDHFLRKQLNDPVLRSAADVITGGGQTQANPTVSIPNGGFGTPYGQIGFGGRPLENRLKTGDCGEYCAEYTINAGSYYEKVWSVMLMTESADNFISASRGDFLDPRYRAISLADLFPDGFRRWLGNNLTGP